MFCAGPAVPVFTILLALQLGWSAAETADCKPGGESVIGFLRYKCSEDGKTITPIGCITEDGQNVDIDQTVQTKWFTYKCEMLSDAVAQLSPIGCVVEDMDVELNGRTVYDNFYYECIASKGGLALDVVGCQDENNELVLIGKTFTRGQFMFECTARDGMVFEKGLSCIVDGYEVPVHKKFKDQDFAYRCTRKDKYGIRKETIGCLADDSVIIEPGEEFTRSGFRYRCDKQDKQEGTHLTHSLLGCMGLDATGAVKHYDFDQTWEKPLENPQYKYIMECIGNKDAAEQKPVKCGVERDGKTMEVDVGCVTEYSKTQVFVCQAEKVGYIEMRLLTYTKEVALSAVASKFGVNVC